MRQHRLAEVSVWNRRGIVFAAVAVAALGIGCGHFGSLAPPLPLHGAASTTNLHRNNAPPARVLTWIYADRAQPAPNWQSVQPYLDYAMVGQSTPDLQLAASIAAAGIGVVEYSNPNRQSQLGPPPHFPNNLPTDYAHDCKGQRIYKVGYGVPTPPPGPPPTPPDHSIYLMDPHSAHLAASWATEVTTFWAQSGVTPTFVFEDVADSLDSTSRPPPCHYGQPDWTNATNGMDSGMLGAVGAAGENVGLIYNGLSGPLHPSPTWTPFALGVNATSSGGMAENCYSRQGAADKAHPDPEPYPEKDAQWLDTENIEIAMAAAQKIFVCNANSDLSPDADKQTGLRLYVIASFLMTYDPSTSVLDEQFVPASGFSVFPESQILATGPVNPPPAQVSDLAVGGVYAREYAACYIKGKQIGPCATVVNPSSTMSYAFPFAGAYGGSLKIVGGGVLDPGAVVRLIPTLPAMMAPRSAVIAYGTAMPSPSPSPTATPLPSPSPT